MSSLGEVSKARKEEEENIVTYRLFVLPCIGLLEYKEILQVYHDLLNKLKHFTQAKIKKHFWHVDSFRLKLTYLQESGLYCLQGQSCFAENVQDEWIIVNLLRRITETFELIAQVFDNDGQFLLIEAAEHLPEWLEPHSSTHRLFIQNGNLHIIPPSILKEKEISLKSAILSLSENDCNASEAIQKAAFKQTEASTHTARCILPKKYAVVLHENPELICPVVRASLYRSETDTKHVRDMRTLNVTDLNELVQAYVVFTRCTYAQLMFQNLRLTRGVISFLEQQVDSCYNLIITTLLDKLQREVTEFSKDESALLLGLKICIGMEVVCTNSKWDRIDDVRSDCSYVGLDKSLMSAAFLEHLELVGNVDFMGFRLKSVKQRVSSSLEEKSIEYNAEGTEDSDEWMYVDNSSFGGLIPVENDENKMEQLFCSVKNFMETESGYEGVDVLDSEGVSFDADKFLHLFGDYAGINSEFNENDVVEQMDKELCEHKDIGSVVEQLHDETEHPLDLNFTVVNNLVESFRSQNGAPGPTSSILSELTQPRSSTDGP